MFHLLAYTANQAVTATPVALTALTDVYATISPNGNYFLPRDLRVGMGYAQGPNITQARINSPTLRQISLPHIQPVATASAPPSNQQFVPLLQNGPSIPAADELSVETTNGGGAAERQFALLWMHDGNLNVPVGDRITVRATATNTGGNLVWSASTFALDQLLPNGRYAVIGMDIVGANLIAGRLVFPESGPKPGVLARQSLGVFPNPIFRNGRLGTFGQFESTAPPSLEILGSAAGTTQTLFLDLVKVR